MASRATNMQTEATTRRKLRALGVSLRSAAGSVEGSLAIVAVLLSLFFLVQYPDQFGTTSNLIDMSRVAAILLVVAVGQAFALLIGGFDLSVAANMGLSGTVAAYVMVRDGMLAGVLAGLATGAAVGLTNGAIIAYLKVSPFIATLGTLTFATGLANQVSQGTSIGPLPNAFDWFGARNLGQVPTTVVIAAGIVLFAWLILARTRLGLYIYSIGGGRQACVTAGVPVARIEVATYTCCGLVAGLAGLMLTSRIGIGQSSTGAGYELSSIATAVVGGVAIGGGIGRIRGVIMGVVILTVLTTGLDIAGTSEFTQSMATGVVLIVAVAFGGFRGRGIIRWRGGLRRHQHR